MDHDKALELAVCQTSNRTQLRLLVRHNNNNNNSTEQNKKREKEKEKFRKRRHSVPSPLARTPPSVANAKAATSA